MTSEGRIYRKTRPGHYQPTKGFWRKLVRPIQARKFTTIFFAEVGRFIFSLNPFPESLSRLNQSKNIFKCPLTRVDYFSDTSGFRNGDFLKNVQRLDLFCCPFHNLSELAGRKYGTSRGQSYVGRMFLSCIYISSCI